MDDVCSMIDELRTSVQRVIVGNHQTIDRMIEMLITGGHALSEDEPGVGKTLLAESLARASNLEYAWLQGTPDLRPSDITGVNAWMPATSKYEFRPGPVFANILVNDEINRASPKTQAALLEAMQNRRVTVDGVTHDLPSPFLVLATQNPLEHDGVYPLPAAQVDRFSIRLTMQELSAKEETEVYARTEIATPQAKPVTGFDILLIQKEYEKIHVDPRFRRYVADLMAAAREPESAGIETQFRLGRTTRPGEWLIRMAKAAALMEGKWYITADHIKDRLFSVLNHRVHSGYDMLISGELLSKAEHEFTPALIGAVAVPGVSEDELEEAAAKARNN